jgi:thiamine biosynthesis protein ThiS
MKVSIFIFYIFFNGERYVFQTYKFFTLENLRTFFNYKKNLIVIEYNGKIIHPENWSMITLKNFDTIEILTVVGGG